jgi:hypothetical protein
MVHIMTTIRTVDVTIADPTGMKKILSAVNLVKNPRGANSTAVGGSSGTGGASTLSYPTTGGPLTDAPTFIRRTISTVPTGADITITMGSQTITALDASHIGKTLNFAVYARASKACATPGIPYGSIGWFNSSEGFISGATGGSTTLAANTWQRLGIFTATVPANTARFQFQVTFPVSGVSGGVAVGDTFDATAFLVNETVTGFDGSYFDGASVGATWQGTAHASRSSKVVGIG